MRAKTQMHGKTDVLHHDGRGVLPGLQVHRDPLPLAGDRAGHAARGAGRSRHPQDDEIMGVRHRELAGTKTPLEGVQFHPESILTEHGHAMLRNFVELCHDRRSTRSDTVTAADAGDARGDRDGAEVGDDVFGDDPTVNALQERVAALFGREAALFVSSGTQGNLCALMSHCQRGDEVLVGQLAHSYRYEGGGGRGAGSVQPSRCRRSRRRHAAAGRHRRGDQARRRALRAHAPARAGEHLERQVLAQAYLDAATDLAHARGLATHLDGARLFNAIVASGAEPARLVRGFDSVSVCFSKGWARRSARCWSARAEFIARAPRAQGARRRLRQAGLLAAAALYALDHHVERLTEDHALARRLADGLTGIPGITVTAPDTNIVFAEVAGGRAGPCSRT